MKSASIRIHAPAKINLILRILNRRPDGYHDIWSLMHTVTLYDELQLTTRPHGHGIELQCDDATLAVDHTNLVVRAATLMLERANRPIGLFIKLKKRIPMGAGLGGGSSDAAATILGLNQLLALDWSKTAMQHLGQALGSDVPFFFDSPAAVVTGRGEQIHPSAVPDSRWVLLVNPGFAINTGWAYHELAASRHHVATVAHSETHVEQQLSKAPSLKWEDIVTAGMNDFEPVVFETYSVLREIKVALTEAGADLALLSGSGATMFGIFQDHRLAAQAQEMFGRDRRYKVYLVETCRQGLTYISE